MSKEEQKIEYEDCCYDFTDRPPCKAAEKSESGVYKCLALDDTDFRKIIGYCEVCGAPFYQNRECPFYKEVEDE